MALGLEPGEEQNAALARAVIGGLLFATPTTLLVVPYLFAMLRKGNDGKQAHGCSRRFQNERPSVMTHSVDSQGHRNVRCWAYGSDSMCDRQRCRPGTAASD